MAILLNGDYDHSPLSVELKLSIEGKEGWRNFSLELANGKEILAACNGQMSTEDFERLFEILQSRATVTTPSLEFTPIEPFFILRTKSLRNEQTEMFVMDYRSRTVKK